MKRSLYIACFGFVALTLGSGWATLREMEKLREHNAALTVELERYTIAVLQMARSELAFLNLPPNRKTEAVSAQSKLDALLRSYPEGRSREEDGCIRRLRIAFAKRRMSFETASFAPAGGEVYRLISDLDDHRKHRAAEMERMETREFSRIRGRAVAYLLLSLGAGVALAVLTTRHILGLQQGIETKLATVRTLSRRIVEIQEAERKQIARELHDQVGQSLSALSIDASRLATRLPPNDEGAKELAEAIRGNAEGIVASVRDMSLKLRPSMLDDLGLVPAIEWQAREVSRRGPAEVEVLHENVAGQLPEDVKICVYRIVQESLSNVLQHADARSVTVTLRQSQDRIYVEVTDDGKGFDPSTVRGMGLLGMEERVGQLNGDLKVESAAGRGAAIRASIPVRL